MDDTPASQPAPHDVIDSPTPEPSTAANRRCRLCHRFEIPYGNYYSSEHSWGDILTCAQACASCDVVVRGCRSWLDKAGKKDWTPTSLILNFRKPYESIGYGVPRALRRVSGIPRYEREDHEKVWPVQDSINCSHLVGMNFTSNIIWLGMFEIKGPSLPEPWNRFVDWSYITTENTGSEQALQVARSWLQNCCETHVICDRIHDQALPTRLLDLEAFGSEGVVRLVETSSEHGQYAALSHCWGATPQFTTTKATLAERKRRIRCGQLTRTFREAAQVACALDIRYLWIDSLCIVQDDRDDWAREASEMSTVYRNAMITISATASRSGNEGLFRQSPEVLVRSMMKRSPTFVFRAARIHMSAHPFEQEEFPLLSRAWGLQERLLPLRVLHFTNAELVFECLEEQRCECKGSEGNSLDRHIQLFKHHLRKRISRPESLDAWEKTVMEYSTRQLTYPSDKLVAVAGLAKNFAEPGDRYLAGLWESGLIEHLQWFVYNERFQIQERPTWRAPSWSWAAVKTQLWYNSRLNPIDASKYGAATANVLNCSVVSKSVDTYGEILSGTLQLLARFTEVTWERIARSPDDWRGSHIDCINFPSGYQRGFYLDALIDDQPLPGAKSKDSDIACVLLVEDIGPRRRKLLVLRRLNSNRHVFERIGIVDERVEANDERCLRDADNIFPIEKVVVEIV